MDVVMLGVVVIQPAHIDQVRDDIELVRPLFSFLKIPSRSFDREWNYPSQSRSCLAITTSVFSL